MMDDALIWNDDQTNLPPTPAIPAFGLSGFLMRNTVLYWTDMLSRKGRRSGG